MMNMWFNLLTTTTLIAVQLCAVNAQNFSLSQPATGPSITCQGSDVTLQCVILRSGTPADLIWRRNGRLVDTNVLTNHQFVFNPTYNANTDLVITNVGLEDDNTEYECTVANSNITSSIVLNVTGRPQISGINFSEVCFSEFTVSWSNINGMACGPVNYTVAILPLHENVSMMEINETVYRFTQLLRGVVYNVNVTGANRIDTGNTIKGDVRTLPDMELGTLSKICVTYILIERNDVNMSYCGEGISYTASIFPGNMNMPKEEGRIYNFTNLTSETEYTVVINAIRGDDIIYSSLLRNSTQTSSRPPPVSRVTASSTTTSSNQQDITISWTVPKIIDQCSTSEISNYVIQISFMNQTGSMDSARMDVGVDETMPISMRNTFNNEHPIKFTTYAITVFAENDGGLSEPSDAITIQGGGGDDFPWWIIIIIVVILVCIGCCTSSIFIFCCDKPVEGCAIKCCYITLTICSFGLALLIWFVYDSIKKCRSKDKEESSKENGTCYIILAVCSCGLTILIWWIYEKARSCKVKDGGDAPDSQNMPLQDTKKPVRSAAEEQALYSYARTGPINVVMEGGSSARPGDKPRQT